MTLYNTINIDGSIIPTLIEMCQKTPNHRALYVAYNIKCMSAVREELLAHFNNMQGCRIYSGSAVYFPNGSKLQCLLQISKVDRYQDLELDTVGYNVELDSKCHNLLHTRLRGPGVNTILIETHDRGQL